MKIIPTVFEQDIQEIEKRIKLIEDVADLIEIDIADGELVNGETYLDLDKMAQIDTPIAFGVHLMTSEPQEYLKERVEKVTRISTQVESKVNIEKFIKRAKELGYRVGLSLNPETEVTQVEPYLNDIDYLQLMSVTPGGKGRSFNEDILLKIKTFKNVHPNIPVQVDGGIKEHILPQLLNIGVDNVVMNTALFDSENPKETLTRLKNQFEGQKMQDTPANNTQINSLADAVGARKIKKIAFLGGADWQEDSQVYKDTFAVAKLLAENGYEIVNGGGPGVMRASTKGGHAGGGKVLAITYHPNKPKAHFEGVDPENDFDEEVYTLDYFDRTKVMLQNSEVHIIFQGATGTISEFGMTWASSRIHEGNHKPIVVYGDFWNTIIDCFSKTMNLRDGEADLLKICTTPEEVLDYIQGLEK
jgi:ribulose-phosphate 3-epimerase